MSKFTAFTVNDQPDFSAGLTTQSSEDLQGDVLVKVLYSDVNYKDALAAKEKGGVIRNYPMTPGIDLAGEVVESSVPEFVVGDQVLVTGYGLGVTHPGGFSELQRVPAQWLVKEPKLSAKKSMLYGTAGFTAALAVKALTEQNYAKDCPIIVTGASGGVGSVSIALLKKLGYTNITALSRKKDADWLYDLGAKTIESPEKWLPEKIKPLAKQEVTAVIDTVGGHLLSALLPQINYGGAAFLCGNASGIKIDTTVLPFILRGIKMVGIDSVNVAMPERKNIWSLLANAWDVSETLYSKEISLEELPETLQSLLEGTHHGRTILKVAKS